MAARSPQHNGAGWFTTPAQVNHRRYEALRAFFVDGLTYQQAADRFGYTRWAMVNLVREHRAGRLELFAPTRKPGPPPGVAPAKDRARGRVIGLRRQGLSTYEISARLAAEHTPLNRTSVAEILTEEGFGRLLRGPSQTRAAPRPPLAATPACPGPRSSTLTPGPIGWSPPGPGCCWSCPTWSPWTCLVWSAGPATPAPGGSPTSMTCWPIPPPGCWPGLGSCPRSPRSPATPTGCPTTTSAPSWPPWTRT